MQGRRLAVAIHHHKGKGVSVRNPPKMSFSEMNSDGWVSRLKADFLSGGAIIVTQTPANEDGAAVLLLSRMIGKPMWTTVPRRPGNADCLEDIVHRIEAVNTPAVSKMGLPVLSTTASEFGCHTDESYLSEPAEAIALHCIRQASTGGGTILADVRDLVGTLRVCDAEALRGDFPHRSGSACILSGSNDSPAIRYNPYEFSRGKGEVLSTRQRCAMAALDEAIGACAIVIRLDPGDCLILDNRRILHGRTSFDPSDGRLFLRVRLRIS